MAIGIGRRRALRLAVPALAIGVIAWLVYRNWDQIAAYDWRLDLFYVAVAFPLYLLGALVSAYLWHSIIAHVSGVRSFRRDLYIFGIGLLARRIPGGIWNVTSRVFLYRREGYPLGTTVSAWVLEQFASALSGLYLVGLLLLFQPRALEPGLQLGGVTALILLTVLLYPPVLDRALGLALRFRNPTAPRPPGTNLGHTLSWLCMGMTMWGFGGLVLYAVARGLAGDLAIDPIAVVRAWTIAGTMCVLLFTILPSGFGVFEITLVALLGADLPAALALAVPLTARLLNTAFDALFATAVWASRLGVLNRHAEAATPEMGDTGPGGRRAQ